MTRKEERQQRSRKRAEEFKRRRRTHVTLFTVALVLYIGVPLLWNGAVEFGWAHPIHNPGFKDSLNMVNGVLIAVILFNMTTVLRPQKLDSLHWPNWLKRKPKENDESRVEQPSAQ